jgi:hypothetical protein
MDNAKPRTVAPMRLRERFHAVQALCLSISLASE